MAQEVKEIYKDLMVNSIDFFQKSVTAFDKEEYKYSIIFFASAIEVCMKARIAKKHWMLIAEHAKIITPTEFLAGEVKTITLNKCIEMIEKSFKDRVSKEYKISTQKIQNQRNKAIHFHLEYTKDEVAREQIKAYGLLYDLWNNNWDVWSPILEDFLLDIRNISLKLREHLEFVYLVKKQEIDRWADRGKISQCPKCNYDALRTWVTVKDASLPWLEGDETITVITKDCIVCKDVSQEITDDKIEFLPFEKSEVFVCDECYDDMQLITFRGEQKVFCINCLVMHDPKSMLECESCGNFYYKDDISFSEGNQFDENLCKFCHDSKVVKFNIENNRP